jgi:hypothetical protein
MGFKGVTIMDQRVRFISEYLRGIWNTEYSSQKSEFF